MRRCGFVPILSHSLGRSYWFCAYKEKVLKLLDPSGRPLYWITAEEFGWHLEEGTDYWAVYHGYVSITPLHLDLTNYKYLEKLKEAFRP